MKGEIAIVCITLIGGITATGLCAQDAKTGTQRWYIPDHGLMQFAGSIGFISAGAGYQYLHGKLHSDMLYGYVPRSAGGVTLHTLTLKNTFSPFVIPAGKSILVTPLSIGGYLSYTPGRRFFFRAGPSGGYPSGYYWWSSALRYGIFIGGNVQHKPGSGAWFKSIAPYYELGIHDLDLYSYVSNREFLRLNNVLSLGLGVRIPFYTD